MKPAGGDSGSPDHLLLDGQVKLLYKSAQLTYGVTLVNDRMGHASGDALLVDVAHRLTGCVREVDTIARLGGDEFVVLVDGPTQKTEVRAVAEKILASLRKPYRLGTESTTISVSIGASLYPDDGGDTESLLEHADIAM